MDPASDIRACLTVLQKLLCDAGAKNVAVRFWDGSTWKLRADQPPAATIVLKHEASFKRMLRLPLDLALGEAYIYNDVDVEGSLDAVVPLADRLIQRKWTPMEWLRCGAASWRQRSLKRLPEETRALALRGRRHGKPRTKQAMRFHYDVPIEFYRLWLDEQLVYSCAYYEQPDDDLEMAQRHQLDYLSRKLRLQPNDHVLDIGCGWGGFALHAAQEYGAIVHGITLSRRQAEVAMQRVAALGLSRRCRIEVRDYRDVSGEALYDKIISVGMIEHVGRAQLRRFFERAEQLLLPGGVCATQGIGTRGGRPSLGPFADRYVFPDAEWPPLDDVVGAAEAVGFEVRDVENLREHYALTVDAWRERLERRHVEAIHIVGDITYRVWRVSLAAAAYLFRSGRLSLYQTVAVKASGGKARLPLTRVNWYEPSSTAIHDEQKEAA